MWTTYRPLHSTIFDEVYRGYRRRPTSLSLNTQWIPPIEYPNSYRRNPTGIYSRILKTKTYFDNIAGREQAQPKAVTPPSSDYTDAYLSAFAPKPIVPTRRIYRISAPVFASAAPIRTLLFAKNSSKTSQTRFHTINNPPVSNLLDSIKSLLPSSSSGSLPSLIPDISIKSQPISHAQTSLSETETETHHSDPSTSLRNDLPSEKTIHSIPRPSSFTVPIPDRPNLPSEYVNKSSPNIPISPPMVKTTYKPSVSFQSAPLSLSTDIQQSSTTERIVPPPPPPRRSHIEKHVDRPETLVFQHDEDIRSSPLITPSPLPTPLLESPVTRIETKTEPERTSAEDASTSSKPIEIFEQTINKYDSIIDQISSILESVSPLSSTVSSMSPGKSVLDYEVTADGSPIIQRKTTEPEASQSTTSTVTKTNAPHPKRKYLIRDDSYEKIVTAIADLDIEMTPPPETQEPTTTVIEEEKRDQQLSSDHVNDEQHTLSFINERRRSIEIPPPYEQKLSSIHENEESEQPMASISSANDVELEVPSTITTELPDQQADLSPYLPNVEITEEQTVQPNYRISPNKKNGKHVTWGEIMVNSSDSENSFSQSSTEETGSFEKEYLITNESSTIVEQQINSPTVIENIDVDDEVQTITPIELSDLNDQTIISSESAELPITIDPRLIKSSSSPDTLSGSSDSIDGQTTSSDLNESRSSQDEQTISSESSGEIQFVSTIQSSKQDTFTVDEPLTTSEPSTEVETSLLSFPIVESPINTLIDSISTRYLSSDVYHGYLGDHKQFVENRSDTNTADKKLFLLASLRQTIATPATPLIESIQSVVSTMRTLNAIIKPVKNDHKVEDDSQDQAMVENSKEENNEYEVQTEVINLNKSTNDEIIAQSMESDSQTDKQEVSASSGMESVSEIGQVNSDSEVILPSFLNDSQEKVLETIQHAVSTNIPIAEETLPGEDEEQSVSDADTIIIEPQLPEIQVLSTTESGNAEHEQQISLADDKIPGDSVPTPTGEDGEQVSKANVLEEKHAGDIEEIITVDSVPEVSDSTPTPDQFIPTELIQGSSSSSLSPAKSEFSPDKETISLTTALSQVSDDRLTQSTMHHQPSDIISLTNDATTTEETDRQNISTGSLMTEPLPISETNETISPSYDQDDEFILQTVDQLINDIIQTVSLELQQNSIDTHQEILSTDSGLTQSTIPLIDESINTEIDPINSPNDIQELSPTNTEPDSFDLINALRGHIIVLPNSSEQIHQSPPKSPSTTTSSQITSSDRYVSLAIHQMGDSSLERLPAFPLAADLPIYRSCEENASPKPFASSYQTKEEDSTEFDATDNLTSYSDESLIRRLETSAANQQKDFDPSSTEDDVDEEIEQHDLTDLEHIIDKLAQPSSTSISRHDESYQRYDQAVTLSSNDSSTSSPRQRPDDIYYIPGYSGLWRPFGSNENANASVDYDADDERRSVSKTRTFIRPISSTQRPLSFEYPPDQSMISTEPENQPLNQFPHDRSESDSYQTCPSSIPKPIEDSDEITPDESIYLIRPYERGVSLPITMKIDCDEMALRLSTSSPIETPSYSINPPDSSSSSAHSEPIFLPKRDSTSSASSSSTSQQSDEQRVPSWLDIIDTITTTTEGPVEARITFLKSAKGPISISECHSQGHYIIIENTSRSKIVDLTHWKLYQENEDEDKIIYTFPDHCLLKPNHSLKILTQTNQSEQRSDDLIAYSLSSWYTGPNIYTKLTNQSGKDCATLTKTTLTS